MTSPHPAVNQAVLALLEKAKYHTSDIGIVAGKPEIVGALVRLWLCIPDTAVALRAHEILLALLLADAENLFLDSGLTLADEGLLWRRIFRDKDIYGSLYSICSLSTAGQEGQIPTKDKTIAQARLLDMLLCIDSEPIRTSQLRDVEERYGVKNGGLLHFAAMHMIDHEGDVLMHMTLIDFFTKYLSKKLPGVPKSKDDSLSFEESTSFALQFARETGFHERTMGYYLSLDSHPTLERTYLYGSAAKYIAIYCNIYPQDVVNQWGFVKSVLARLTLVFQRQWSRVNHDLHVMESLPRVVLIPRDHASPFLLLPTVSANPDILNTLAYMFHGDSDPRLSTSIQQENSAATRALFFLYMEHHEDFWPQIVHAASTIAVKDVALAAISLIGAVITAMWAPLPETSPSDSLYPLPTEKALMEKCVMDGVSLPDSGIKTIMSYPAKSSVVPYLMKPAQIFSNLVGGGQGDVESAAYNVAVAKHDVLILLHQRLKDWLSSDEDSEGMMTAIRRRIAQGPMGGTSEVGGRVATLDL